MKRSGKIALAVGVGCILLGCIGVFGVFAHLGFDAGRLEGPWLDFPETQAGSQDSAGAVETVTYTVTDPFDRIQVREECGHVRFVLTDGGPCPGGVRPMGRCEAYRGHRGRRPFHHGRRTPAGGTNASASGSPR